MITTENPAKRAIGAVLVAVKPEADDLLDEVTAYLNNRIHESVENSQAVWMNDWLVRRQEWMKRIGQLLSATEVIAISPTTRTAAGVYKARNEGRLLGIDVGDRVYFPALQFTNSGAPAPWVRPLCAALPDAESMLQFLSAARPALKGRSYAERLRDSKQDATWIPAMVAEAERIAVAEAR